MARVLTKRKRAWVAKFKPENVSGTALTPNAGVESRYQRQLDALIRSMTADVEKQIARLFKGEAAEQFFAQDASVASQARMLLDKLIKKYDQVFTDASWPIAEQFAAGSDKASSTAVHSSLQQLSGGMSLPTSAITAPMKEILKATVAENVQLIKSIPQKYLTQVQGAVMRSITTGNGMADLVPFLKKQKGITERRARMIANDQTRKAMNNLSRGRLEKLGVKKYRWLHTAGSNEPRELHKRMSGNIYSWDEPPIIDEKTGERGHPGTAINCRCKAIPVLTFDEIEEQ